jgi:hypothetical protein
MGRLINTEKSYSVSLAPDSLAAKLKELLQETRMSRIALLPVLCGIVATPAVVAQDHAAVGVYADFRLWQTDTNFAGVSGQRGVGLGHHLMLEGEMSYDVNQGFTETFENGGSITVNRSN